MNCSEIKICFYKLALVFCGVFLCATPTRAQQTELRSVLVLYDSRYEKTFEKSEAFDLGQTVLNYLGLLPEYRDINKRPLPDDKEMLRFRGVLTWFQADKMEEPLSYMNWLNEQLEAGRKVVILGNVGCLGQVKDDPELAKEVGRLFNGLGLEFMGNFTVRQSLLRYALKDPLMVEFERNYPCFPETYYQLQPLGNSTRTWLGISRKDMSNATSSMIITGSNGGFAASPFIRWMDPETYRQQWYLNPFLFFEKAFGLQGLPIPDPTTLSGLRMAFSHIDGDAFGGFSNVDKKKVCAEIVRDYIIKKFDFPISVSVISGEIDPAAIGNAEMVELAREIFALPNVEAASHAYSHPFFWNPEDLKSKEIYGTQYGIKIPGYKFDTRTEVAGSMDYISRNLVPSGKKCKLMFWSGDCVPGEDALNSCTSAGALNINGGDTIFDNVNNSYSTVSPMYRQVDNFVQFYTGQANENILTHLWEGPYYAFREIVTTIEKTGFPRRIKPIDIYYHFYSGEFHASINTLQKVYEWVMKQEIAPVYTSEYLMAARDFLQVRIVRNGPLSFSVKQYGKCLTCRFDRAKNEIDFANCRNVVGYVREDTGLYVSLLPGKDEAVITFFPDSTISGTVPHVRKATGYVNEFESTNKSIYLEYSGFGSGWIEFAGLAPDAHVKVSGSGIEEGEAEGQVSKNGTLRVENMRTGNATLVIE